MADENCPASAFEFDADLISEAELRWIDRR